MAKFFKVSVPLNRSFMLDPRVDSWVFFQDPHPCSLSGTYAHRSAAQSPACSPRSSFATPTALNRDHIDHYFSRRRPQPRPPGSRGSFEALLIHAGNHLRRMAVASIRLSRFGASEPNGARLDSVTASNNRIASSTGFELCNGIRSGSLVRDR